MQFTDADRIAVYGRSGSGKTVWLKRYLKGKKRVIVLDPMDEYHEMTTRITHKTAGPIEALRRAILANPDSYRIAFVPRGGKEAETLNLISSMLWDGMEGYRRARRKWERAGSKRAGKTAPHIYLIVEEMNLSFKVHGGAERAPAFADICSRGRRSGIEVAGCTQRVKEVNTRFRGNCSKVVVFAQADKLDTTAAAEALYSSPAEIRDLKPLEFIYRENNQISRGKIKFQKS